MTNLMKAHKEWASRPMDQRYVSLEDLYSAVSRRKEQSWEETIPTKSLVVEDQEDDLILNAGGQRLTMSNWSFGQLCTAVGAPASYMRQLPTDLAAKCMQEGISDPKRENSLVLGSGDRLRSVTSPTYGRIYDEQVVRHVMDSNRDDRWKIPTASYASSNPKLATTLYASDRDIFIFLVDEKNEIEIDGDVLYRGFYCWNSEVGAATFGLTTFLYRTVCDNRIIWGTQDVKELRLRHSKNAPKRFGYEIWNYIERYAEESTRGITLDVQAALKTPVPLNEGTGETVPLWLQEQGFPKGVSEAAYEKAVAEEGRADTVWAVVQGLTAVARDMDTKLGHSDQRVLLERQAGDLLEKFRVAA